MSPLVILLNILFSSVGFAYFIYGKKNQNFVFIFDGLILCVFPYFVSSVTITLVLGLLLIIFPFIYKN